MAPLISPEANALLQIIIAVLLTIGIVIKRRQRFWHGATMLVAVTLTILSVFLIMFPSLLSTEIINTQPLHVISIATIVHSALGLIIMILGVFLVASWHLQSSVKTCFERKKLMRATAALWLAAGLIGFSLYYLLYLY